MCNHEFVWVEGTSPNKVWKIWKCSVCGYIEDVVLKELGKSEVDKNQSYYDGMFKCIEAVKKQYPEYSDEVVSHYAISLFIQIARGR